MGWVIGSRVGLVRNIGLLRKAIHGWNGKKRAVFRSIPGPKQSLEGAEGLLT